MTINTKPTAMQATAGQPRQRLDQATADAYLERLGCARPDRTDAESLRHLQERHVRTVPFENVDCVRRRPLHLGRLAVDKIVHERRGGGCFELNSSFGLLLTAVGFDVTVVAAQFVDGQSWTFPFRHLLLLVDTSEGRQLVDTGFGFGGHRNSLRSLPVDVPGTHEDPHGTYRLEVTPDGDFDVWRDGRMLYRVDSHPRSIEDFSAALWWFMTSPDSDFLAGMFCILPTDNGRRSLRDRKLTLLQGSEKVTVELGDDNEVRRALVEHFGVVVDDLPDLGVPGPVIAPRMAAALGLGSPDR